MATIYQEICAFWRAKPFSTEAAFDTALSRFRILFAYHSGKLENRAITYQDTREIFEKGRVTGHCSNNRWFRQPICTQGLSTYIHSPTGMDVWGACS